MKEQTKTKHPNIKIDTHILKKQNHPVSDDVLAEFINNHDSLRNLAAQINQIEIKELSGLMTPHKSDHYSRKIERIYSRQEIKDLVSKNLISEYQHEYIVKAVTDYLYSLHVTK